MIDEKLIGFVVGYVIYKRLRNMWHFIQFELLLQIIVGNIHIVFICDKNMANEITRFGGLKLTKNKLRQNTLGQFQVD